MFGDEIHYKAGLLIQRRAGVDFTSEFQRAKRDLHAVSNPMSKAASAYTVYLFHRYGWGRVSKDDRRALKYLKSSTNAGYPAAGMDLARHHMANKAFAKAKRCIERCNRALSKRDLPDQAQYEDDRRDMMRLLAVIRSTIHDTEDPSEGTGSYNQQAPPS